MSFDGASRAEGDKKVEVLGTEGGLEVALLLATVEGGRREGPVRFSILEDLFELLCQCRADSAVEVELILREVYGASLAEG